MRSFLTFLILLAALSIPRISFADTSSDSGWKSTLLIYLMGPNIDGDIGLGPVEGNVDLDPGNVFDAFDSGFLGLFGAEKDRWGFLIDTVYMDLSQDATSMGGQIAGEVGVEQLILGGLVSYRLNDSARLLFGGLYVDLDNTLRLTGPIQERRFSVSEDWVDPVIGLRLTKPLSEKWELGGLAHIGGFGVGSDFTWQLSGDVSYAFTERTHLVMGFRYIDFDYEDGSGLNYFKFDVAEYGLAAGLRFDF
jgi:hypothetical protein